MDGGAENLSVPCETPRHLNPDSSSSSSSAPTLLAPPGERSRNCPESDVTHFYGILINFRSISVHKD